MDTQTLERLLDQPDVVEMLERRRRLGKGYTRQQILDRPERLEEMIQQCWDEADEHGRREEEAALERAMASKDASITKVISVRLGLNKPIF